MKKKIQQQVTDTLRDVVMQRVIYYFCDIKRDIEYIEHDASDKKKDKLKLIIYFSRFYLFSTQQAEAGGHPHGAGICSKVSAQ